MSAHDAVQFEIALQALAGSDLSVHLDLGSDVSDLIDNVDILISAHGEAPRCFTVVTLECLKNFFDKSSGTWADFPELIDQYVTGAPLCIVKRVTPETAIRAIRRHLALEHLGKRGGM